MNQRKNAQESRFLHQTRKSKAMMMARLIAEVDAAPILNGSLVRGATEAALHLEEWVSTVDLEGVPEATNAGNVALNRLANIERNAKSVLHNVIIHDDLEQLHTARLKLKKSIYQRLNRNEFEEESDSESSSELSKNSTTSEGRMMPKDIELCSSKANIYFRIMFICLCCWLLIGTVIVIVIHESKFLSKKEVIQGEVTQNLVIVAQEALNQLYIGMVAQKSNVKEFGIWAASGVLNEMSSRKESTQEVLTRNNNYLTEYRAAVQDFENGNQVTTVTTPRAYGGICQNNQTFPIHPINDILTQRTIVLPLLTPNQCGNDATTTGVFSFVVPGYIRYQDYVTTYRRNLARLASFYHMGFGLSVVVTHDRQPLREYVLPQNTLIGRVNHYQTEKQKYDEDLEIWCGMGLVVAFAVLWILLRWMMYSSLSCRLWLFPLLGGFLAGGLLTAILLISQIIFSNALNNEILQAVTSLVEVIAGAMFSPPMIQFDATASFYRAMYNDVLKGEMFSTNLEGTKVIPEEMESVSKAINAPRIALFRRGEYSGIDRGYAIASTYMYDAEWNYLVVRKLPKPFGVNISIAIVIGFSILTSVFIFCYLRWTPLHRLRSFAIGSYFFEHYFHPTHIRYVFYIVVFVASIVGIVGVSFLVSEEMNKHFIELAQDTLVQLGAALRAGPAKDMCTYGCGMPDFVATLYFSQTQLPGEDYPKIKYILSDLPLPFPMQSTFGYEYLGAQLAMNNIHTTLVNAPSFSTPLVNRTNNITDPRYTVRNMLSATGVNASLGFVIERFPRSFKASSFEFSSFSIGVCVMLVLSATVITVCEMEYMDLYQRFMAKKNVRRPLIVMALSTCLIFAGFMLYGGLIDYFIHVELREFAKSELSFMASSLGFRIGLLSLNSKDGHAKTVEFLNKAVKESSTSNMLLGKIVCRFRLVEQYPSRQSDTVIMHNVDIQEPLNLGPLDQGYIPVCGKIDPKYISKHISGSMNYCFVEIPQGAVDEETNTNLPRLFLLVATTDYSWVDTPGKKIWRFSIGVSLLTGILVMSLIGITFFLSMHAAYQHGFPILQDYEMHSFSEPLPSKFSTEFFVPRRHRMIWIASLLFLSIVVLYFSVTAGQFMYSINENHSIRVAHESQSQLLNIVVSQAKCDAYNFIVFPMKANTANQLLVLSEKAGRGALDYYFVTENGLNIFQSSLLNTYYNLTETNGILTTMLSVADEGYGSYCSLIAIKYETLFIANQNSALAMVQTLLSTVSSDVMNGLRVNFVDTINFMYEIMLIREHMRKLFVLDHIAIASYANFGYLYSTESSFPFADEETLVENGKKAALELVDTLTKEITTLSTLATNIASSSKNTLSVMIDQTKEYLSAGVAMNSPDSSIWTIQSKRCSEALSAKNETQEKIAAAQQAAQLASIAYLSSNLTEVLNAELSMRKTIQLVEYLREGEPVENEKPSMVWQRWVALRRIRRMYIVAFSCTVSAFAVLGICIILHFHLLRHKSESIQDMLLSRPVIPGDGEKERKVSEEKSISLFKSDSLESKEVEKSSTGSNSSSVLLKKHSGEHQHDEWDNERGGNSVEAPSEIIFFRKIVRRKRWVLLSVTFFFLITLIPLCCGFWLITLAHDFAESQLDELSVILSIYPKVSTLFETIGKFMEETAKYYVGLITENELLSFLTTLEENVVELKLCYNWDLESTDIACSIQYYNSFVNLNTSFMNEKNSYDIVTSSTDVEDYFTPQSAYARKLLASDFSANDYGVLIPMSSTTTGSAVNTFSEAAYASALAAAKTITNVQDFEQIFNDYQQICTTIDGISETDLRMWHATIAAAKEEGSATAISFGQYNSLVGETALTPLTSSTNQPEGKNAAEAVTNFYKEMITDYGTASQQRALFSDTESPPSDPGASPMTAYVAAGYVSSYLTSTITEAKFSSMFAYNRNLTSYCAALEGEKPLTEYLDEFNAGVLGLYKGLEEKGSITVVPSTINKFIWFTELMIRQISNQDHMDLEYLGDAVRWCSICSFWSLLLSVIVAMYVTYL